MLRECKRKGLNNVTVFMFIICFDLQLSLSSAALAGAQQIWQWFPFISFDICFLLPHKWKATCQSLVHSMGPLIRVGGRVCFMFSLFSGPVVKIVAWFSQVSFVCVEGMSLSMYSFEFERRERKSFGML